MGRLFVNPLMVAFVVVVSAVAFPQEPVDLLPHWISGSNTENYATETTTTTTSSPGCTANLDVKKFGKPHCPTDQQYFDMDTCQFVCPSTQTPVYPTLTSRKYNV